MAGGSAPKQTATNSNEPWSGVKPYLLDLYKSASEDVYKNPQEFYPGQTYANLSPQQQQALTGIEQRAVAGSPLVDSAQGAMQRTLNGDYLAAGNPYMSALSQGIGDAVQQNVGARFAGAGRRMGSPGEVQTFSRDMANALAPYQFQTYGQERQLMQNAAQIAPALAQSDYADLDRLLGVGSAWQQQDQAAINEAMARFQFAQDEPMQRLSQFGTLLGYGSPYQSAATRVSGGGGGPSAAGGLMGAAGGAATGAMIGSVVPGIGTLAGAVGGGIIGGIGGSGIIG